LKKRLWQPLCLMILAFLLAGPTIGYASGSDSIPQVTPYDHPTLGPGLFFPEQVARHHDALTESAIQKAELYERTISDLSLHLDAAEAALAVANDSLRDLPSLISQTKGQAYQAGFRKGRSGWGAFLGYDAIHKEGAGGVGYVYRF